MPSHAGVSFGRWRPYALFQIPDRRKLFAGLELQVFVFIPMIVASGPQLD